MKMILRIVVLLAAFFTVSVMAQTDISGIWQGKLNTGGNNKLTVQFILKKQADGSWSAVVNSPDTGGIKNVKASSAAFNGSKLKIDVSALSGAYAGTYKNGGFTGTWTQAGTSMPLNLKPYTKPVMSAADKKLLEGEWSGKLQTPAGTTHLVFRFKQDSSGGMKGFIHNADMGGNEVPLADIQLADNVLSFKVPAAQVDISGKLIGTHFDGTFIQAGQHVPLEMNKGKYEPPKSVIKLSKEAMARLKGEWYGEISTPAGGMTVVYRFESDKNGKFSVSRENPDQGANSVPVTDVSMTNGTLTLKNSGPFGEFNGKLAGNTITGNVNGPMGSLPVTLKKGEYVPPDYTLSLPQAVMDRLQGKWLGKLKAGPRTLTIIFRFELNRGNKYYGYVDSPDQGNTTLKIMKASFDNGQLSLETKFPKARFEGKLSGNTLDGSWMQGPANLPLSLKKE